MEYKVNAVKLTGNADHVADVYVKTKLQSGEKARDIAERFFKRLAVYACQDCMNELQEIEGFGSVEKIVKVHFDCTDTAYPVPTADIHY